MDSMLSPCNFSFDDFLNPFQNVDKIQQSPSGHLQECDSPYSFIFKTDDHQLDIFDATVPYIKTEPEEVDTFPCLFDDPFIDGSHNVNAIKPGAVLLNNLPNLLDTQYISESLQPLQFKEEHSYSFEKAFEQELRSCLDIGIEKSDFSSSNNLSISSEHSSPSFAVTNGNSVCSENITDSSDSSSDDNESGIGNCSPLHHRQGYGYSPEGGGGSPQSTPSILGGSPFTSSTPLSSSLLFTTHHLSVTSGAATNSLFSTSTSPRNQQQKNVATYGIYNGSGVNRHNSPHQPFFQKIPTSGLLILTEEEKKTLLQEGYSVPSKLPLTKAEERCLKKVRRKIKNKISAQESRRKKKEYMETLEMKLDHVAGENDCLKKKVEQLESNNRSLMTQLRKLQGLVGNVTGTTVKAASQSTCLMMFVLFVTALFTHWMPYGDHLSYPSSHISLAPLSSGLQQHYFPGAGEFMEEGGGGGNKNHGGIQLPSMFYGNDFSQDSPSQSQQFIDDSSPVSAASSNEVIRLVDRSLYMSTVKSRVFGAESSDMNCAVPSPPSFEITEVDQIDSSLEQELVQPVGARNLLNIVVSTAGLASTSTKVVMTSPPSLRNASSPSVSMVVVELPPPKTSRVIQ